MDSLTPSAHQKALSQNFTAALSNTKVVIAASKRNLHGYTFWNPNDSVTFVHFYDALTANVTVGTTAPTFSVPVPVQGGVDIPPGVFPLKRMGTGVIIAANTAQDGVTDDAAPANALLSTVYYK